MQSVKQQLLEALAVELEHLAPGAGVGAALESPRQAAHGDWACTAAMQLAKPLKANPRQLAEQLRGWGGPVLFASHDRAFLDAVVTTMLDLDPAPSAVGPTRQGVAYTGTYTDYLEARAGERRRWAERYASELRHGADEYCDHRLAGLETEIDRLGDQIRAGRDALAARLAREVVGRPGQTAPTGGPTRGAQPPEAAPDHPAQANGHRRAGWSVDPGGPDAHIR